MVHRIILIMGAFVIFLLIKPTHAQTIWLETFDVPDKGFWADSTGTIHSDLSDIAWTVNVDDCFFEKKNDYAKTVTTSGGRFEVLDSQGEAVWTSETIDISPYDAVNLSLEAAETGSGAASQRKYVKAFYILDNAEPKAFESAYEAAGDWGFSLLEQKSIKGHSLQILIKMNSSYANDKVYINNVKVEAIDNAALKPSHIEITQMPVYAFSSDTKQISAMVFNANGEALIIPDIELNLSGNFTQIAHSHENGLYSWNITLNETGKQSFSIYDTNSLLSPADSSLMVFSESEIIARHNFENQQLSGWTTNGEWEISGHDPIEGEHSMKHIEQNEGGVSTLIFPHTPLALGEKDFLVAFDLKNGNWDPSSSNSFYVMLYNEKENGVDMGYAIGVNATGTSDLVSLWKIRNGTPDEIIAQSSFDWDASQTVRVSILRWAKGNWQINATDLNTGHSETILAHDAEIMHIDKMALVFNYSLTRSGQLWFDNYLVAGSNTPPFIENTIAIDASHFKITFNKPIKTDALTNSDFSMYDTQDKEYEISDIEIINPKELLIEVKNHNNDTLMTIVARNIADIHDGQWEATRFAFENVLPAQAHDLIFTEIMADINPEPAQLPAQRYVEIHNRSNKNIQLRNWVYYVRDRGWTIPPRIIRPGDYLVLCGNNFADEFEDSSKLLVFTRFPDILVGGVYQRISSPQGIIIDEVHHSLDWYGDSEKQRGGYSLERIDLERLCNPHGNWTATNDSRGGTPGEINSVNAHNPDNEAPLLLGVNVVTLEQIELYFNKPMDTLSVRNLSNYTIAGINIQKINYERRAFSVTIDLKTALKPRTDYRLTAQNLKDECGNMLERVSIPFALQELRPNDLLINEVLFNPFTGGANFVELYNQSGFTIDVSKLKFASRNNEYELRAIYPVSKEPFPFSNEQYMAFTPNISMVENFYHIPYPENMFEVERLPAYYNTSGNVVLLDQNNQIIDEFAYRDDMHSPWFSDVKGVSLERLSMHEPTNRESNWHSASSLAGYATPGYENSQSETQGQSGVSIELNSDVISPNGDGYNDELIINFHSDTQGYLINMFIYNAHGIEMKRLINNELLGKQNQLVYDCTDNSGKRIPMGSYIIMLELLHLSHKNQVLHEVFHVSDVR